MGRPKGKKNISTTPIEKGVILGTLGKNSERDMNDTDGLVKDLKLKLKLSEARNEELSTELIALTKKHNELEIRYRKVAKAL